MMVAVHNLCQIFNLDCKIVRIENIVSGVTNTRRAWIIQ